MENENRTLTIGRVARMAGVNTETLRYYERRKLLPEPPRSESGYRNFPVDTVDRVRFIKRAQELGFSLKEIQQLLALADGDESGCGDVLTFATTKSADLEAKIRDLKRMHRTLTELMRKCSGKGSIDACPIIESLTGPSTLKSKSKRK